MAASELDLKETLQSLNEILKKRKDAIAKEDMACIQACRQDFEVEDNCEVFINRDEIVKDLEEDYILFQCLNNSFSC